MAEVLPSAVRTATTSGEIPRWNPNNPREFVFTVNITVYATGKLIPIVEVFDEDIATWTEVVRYDEIQEAGDFVFSMRLGEIQGGATPTFSLAQTLPEFPNVRVTIDHEDASSHTYSVSSFFY